MINFIIPGDNGHFPFTLGKGTLYMLWTIIAILPLLALGWFLLSQIELQIDSRIPQVSMRWAGVGQALVIYQEETWWLSVRVLLFKKKWPLAAIINRDAKKKKPVKKIKDRRHAKKRIGIRRILTLIKTFRVVHWEAAIDSNDAICNAWMYALNFLPYTQQHLLINFQDINYFTITIRNKAWRLLYAWIK
ncbi:hypothetical protein [Chitinophaga sp. CF418]|uniref:hypothetical protein n=1 Tax=Chitinophaga sp. CF418 TaxID=1855287 RepID=UPI0009166515|nr:hypothetical protein [Chitinophaga sp. CF418]SHN36172.1 hypothetical protein SAMN05216311_11066 [Chitinophaga sp. CF418]